MMRPRRVQRLSNFVFMHLQKQVLNFLELEVFAAELYRQHRKHVPTPLRALMEEFERVEMQHVHRFADLYEKISGKHRPRCLVSISAARIIATVMAPFGWRTIFRFECWVEERAVKDYRAAMTWVKHAEVRKAIKETLKDEERHAPYLDTLKKFCAEEQHHIEEMEKRLKN